jgi:hypothetical protein
MIAKATHSSSGFRYPTSPVNENAIFKKPFRPVVVLHLNAVVGVQAQSGAEF